MKTRNLEPLFAPKSIAVVGASPTSAGGRVLENIERISYAGSVYPVHPKYKEVRGLACYPSLSAIPENVDAAVLAVRTEAVPAALAEAGEVGARAAVVFATGYAEVGGKGERRQQALREIATRHDMLVCGPNCVGSLSFANASAMYVDVLPDEVSPGPVAAVCQSGTAAIAAVTSGRLQLSHLVSIGNEAVVDAADYLSYFVDDEKTRVIVAFLEGIRSPQLFLDVARRAFEARKPLIVLKVGTSERAKVATVAHTGSLAGSDEVFDGLCEQYGIIRVRDFDEMLDIAGALSLLGARLPKGNRLGSITMSGGQVGMLFDLAGESGLAFDELQDPTREALGDVLGRDLVISNPLDAGGTAGDNAVFTKCIELIARDDNVDLLAVTSPALINWPRTVQTAELTVSLSAAIDKPVIFLTSYAEAIAPKVRALLEAAGVPILPATRRGFGALGRCVRYAAHRPALATASPVPRQREDVTGLLSAGAGVLSEHASLQILAAYGIPVARHVLADSAEIALSVARDIGFPVALKACSPDLPHKSDIGAVRLGLGDTDSVARAYEDVLTRARAAGATNIEGVVVAAMARGIEMIVGTSRDPDFGPTVMVGLGGTMVETFGDVSLRIAPVSHAEANAMIETLRGAALLDGGRGESPVDKTTLADVIVALSHLAVDHCDEIAAIDINPLLVSDDGATAVDALVVLREAD